MAVMAGTARELPPNLRLGTPSALPVLTVRSCHLPRDHTATAVDHYGCDRCNLCGFVVLNEVGPVSTRLKSADGAMCNTCWGDVLAVSTQR